MNEYYLNPGLPQPMPGALDEAYWQGLENNELRLQRCTDCARWQWGPEWICHHCHSDQMSFEAVPPVGIIYSYERVWHPVHPALKDQGPYLVVLVEIPAADNVRVLGNLLGDPHQDVTIGAAVAGVFEHHPDGDPAPFTLLQWRVT